MAAADAVVTAAQSLSPADLVALERCGITAATAAAARLRRVDSMEGAQIVGRNGRGNHAGVLYPYYWPGEDRPREYRLRLDHPDFDSLPDGSVKEKNKYLSPPGARNLLFVPPAVRPEWLSDPAVPIVITEGEKKTLALSGLSWHGHDTQTTPNFVALGISGVWNWRGTIGKTNNADGARVDVKGVIPDFDKIAWKGRKVGIVFDRGIETNETVLWARHMLACELNRRGALVEVFHWPAETPKVNGIDDLIGTLGLSAVARLLREHSRPFDAAPDAWSEPQPVRSTLRPVEALPPDLIPEPYRSWLTDISDRMGCPLDFVAVAALVATGSIVGAGCGIRPKQQDDWLVVPNLWGGVVGRPSIMLKTPALQEATRPLERLAAEAGEAHKAASKDHDADMEMYKARKDAAKEMMRAAARGKKKTGAAIDVVTAKADYSALEEPPAPVWRRYKTNDATVEKLGELLRDNPRGILVFRDELIGLLSQWDRAGHEGDRAFFLEAWNGTGSHDVDRIGRGSIRINNACITLLGGIQPAKLTTYIYSAMKGHDNDGLVQRLQLLVYPDEPGPQQIVDRWPNAEAKNRAYSVFEKLAAMDFIAAGAMAPEEDGGIPFFRFAPDAQELFYAWFNELNEKLHADEEPLVAEHLGKYRSLMPSLVLRA